MIKDYPGTYNQQLLTDEILAAIPSLVIGEGFDRQCLLYMIGNEQGVRLEFPDEHEATIDDLVVAHDPNSLSITEQNDKHKDNVLQWLKDSPLADMTPQEIHDTVEAQILGWDSWEDAKPAFAKWEPVLWAVVMWLVRQR